MSTKIKCERVLTYRKNESTLQGTVIMPWNGNTL